MLVFEERGEREYDGEDKPLGAHMRASLGIEPGPHWWEASALITAPSLLLSLSDQRPPFEIPDRSFLLKFTPIIQPLNHYCLMTQ